MYRPVVWLAFSVLPLLVDVPGPVCGQVLLGESHLGGELSGQLASQHGVVGVVEHPPGHGGR